MQDFVIRKSDGMPTYHFGVVVDDAEAGVTHVLRGQEHLLNTVNHIALQEALGYARPIYAHLPVILNTDGSKMGKRDRDKKDPPRRQRLAQEHEEDPRRPNGRQRRRPRRLVARGRLTASSTPPSNCR